MDDKPVLDFKEPPELSDFSMKITPSTAIMLREISKYHPRKPSYDKLIRAFIHSYHKDPLIRKIVNDALGAV